MNRTDREIPSTAVFHATPRRALQRGTTDGAARVAVAVAAVLLCHDASAQRPSFAELESRVSQLEAAAAESPDGRREIDQTCAVSAGCFAGDSPGFPVTISTAGSYRLKSDLLTASLDVDAIEVTASSASIDLAGFEIAGPGGCTGAGGAIVCATGSGNGIYSATAVLQVSNGRIRDVGGRGLWVVPGGTFRDLEIHGCGAAGITTGDATVVQRVGARRNGNTGIDVGEGSTISDTTSEGNLFSGFDVNAAGVVARSTAAGNGGHGFTSAQLAVSDSSASNNGGAGYSIGVGSRFSRSISRNNALPDSCGGGICTAGKRYYQSSATFALSEAETACDAGFRLANLNDVESRFSAYTYDPRASANAVPRVNLCNWIVQYDGTGAMIVHRYFSTGTVSANIKVVGGSFDDYVEFEDFDLRRFQHGTMMEASAVDSACAGNPDSVVWCVEE